MSTPSPERDWAEYARELGTNLHRARIAKGESQERIAHAAGLAGYTYQKFEKGSRSPARPRTRLCAPCSPSARRSISS
ncbi:hypothetical protein Q0F99_12720 [Rathayibacter oskolensis]|uniref:helix-turn-helix domain-containing protein n=1 Tax=Rathayibacter oskolensis TaxID=1891671 RepID=UPI00265FCBDF|nr:hypothetical protein [Rathayibacter oskolensis]WKK70676.1 hypothetical protein Q0F99_12720 [Rathayibacter oskolensis]